MTHQGRKLEELIHQDRRDVTEIAKKMGYHRTRIYILIATKTFNKNQLARIAKAGYDITKITDNKEDAIIIDSTIQIKKLEKTVKDLEETVDTIQDDSSELNKKFNNLHRDYINLYDMAVKLQNELKRINQKWKASEDKQEKKVLTISKRA